MKEKGIKKKAKGLWVVCRLVAGAAAVFAVMVFACFLPSGQELATVDIDGRKLPPRSSDFIRTVQPWIKQPRLVHISRATRPSWYDNVTIFTLYHGQIVSNKIVKVDPDPPDGFVYKFVQAVRDRRTEFYMDMGWDDPNPRRDLNSTRRE